MSKPKNNVVKLKSLTFIFVILDKIKETFTKRLESQTHIPVLKRPYISRMSRQSLSPLQPLHVLMYEILLQMHNALLTPSPSLHVLQYINFNPRTIRIPLHGPDHFDSPLFPLTIRYQQAPSKSTIP